MIPHGFTKRSRAHWRRSRGERIKRLLIEMPPRHGKTKEVSVNFPAWILGKHPNWPIINAAYGSDLSEKSSAECRDLVRSERYAAIFPQLKVKMDTKAKNFWQVEQGEKDTIEYISGGSYQAVGVGGAATGFGAKILIVDDPVKNAEEANSEVMRQKVWEWYSKVARSRLEDGGAVILIMTRWHEDDLAGRCLLTDQHWHRIRYPAIAEEDEPKRKKGEALWPERYPVSALEDLRRDTDESTWFSLYQQQPRKAGKQSFDPSWFPTFTLEDLKGKVFNRYAMIDVADTKKEGADWTGLVVGDWSVDDKWYFPHIKRHSVNVKDLIDLIFWVWITWKPIAIGIEKKAFADQVKPLLDDEAVKRGIYPVVIQLEDGGRSKIGRITGALQGRAEHKRILLQAEPTDDTEAFKTELWSFPKGRWDDLIDAAAYMEQIGTRPFAPVHDMQIERNRVENESVGFN
jgi:phage terminase large subunit-like protein